MSDRNEEIYAARQAGQTLSQLAAKYRLTTERIRQITVAVERKKTAAARLAAARNKQDATAAALLLELAGIEVSVQQLQGRLEILMEGFPNYNIDDLGLSTRSHNCLVSLGVTSVWDIIQFTKEELFFIPNVGRKSLNEIIELLKSFGLELRKRNVPASPWALTALKRLIETRRL